MDSNITINIVEPGSTPVVPDTGLFTSSTNGTTIAITVTAVAIILAMIYIYIYIY